MNNSMVLCGIPSSSTWKPKHIELEYLQKEHISQSIFRLGKEREKESNAFDEDMAHAIALKNNSHLSSPEHHVGNFEFVDQSIDKT